MPSASPRQIPTTHQQALATRTGAIPERIYPGEALATMAAECDYLVVTVPLTEQTRHIVNERVLDAMKTTGILINIARGSVVDEKALITALSQDKIGGAGAGCVRERAVTDDKPSLADGQCDYQSRMFPA